MIFSEHACGGVPPRTHANSTPPAVMRVDSCVTPKANGGPCRSPTACLKPNRRDGGPHWPEYALYFPEILPRRFRNAGTVGELTWLVFNRPPVQYFFCSVFVGAMPAGSRYFRGGSGNTPIHYGRSIATQGHSRKTETGRGPVSSNRFLVTRRLRRLLPWGEPPTATGTVISVVRDAGSWINFQMRWGIRIADRQKDRQGRRKAGPYRGKSPGRRAGATRVFRTQPNTVHHCQAGTRTGGPRRQCIHRE